MKRSVIVTGDDFGFSRGVNRAVLEAHERGVLTGASLMVTGAAWEEAVALARAHPRLAVGLHLVVAAGRPVLPARAIPRLVDAEGMFPDAPMRLGLRYQFDQEARRQLRAEIRAQLERFRQTGLPLSHVDGHLHLHMHPVVLGILVDLAEEFGITAIRLPWEELSVTLAIDQAGAASKAILCGVFGALRRHGERRLRAAGIAFPDRVYGLLGNGRMTEEYWLALIPRIRANRIEVYAHPAVAVDGEPFNMPPEVGPRELAALVSDRVRRALASHGFALARYGDEC